MSQHEAATVTLPDKPSALIRLALEWEPREIADAASSPARFRSDMETLASDLEREGL